LPTQAKVVENTVAAILPRSGMSANIPASLVPGMPKTK